MSKTLEKSVLLTLLTISLISCNSANLDKLKLEDLPKGEVLIGKNYHKGWGSVTGSRNIYFTYGKSPTGEIGGVGLAPDHKFLYKVQDLVEKWTEIDNPKVQQTIKFQEKLLKKVPQL